MLASNPPMHRETHRVTAYSNSIVTWTDSELVAESLYLFDYDASAFVCVSGTYRACCQIAGETLHIESLERTATVADPYAVSVDAMEELGTYEVDLYVSQERGVGTYLATPDPAFSDFRGVIAHTPTDSVYERIDAPIQVTTADPLFDTGFEVELSTESGVVLQSVETEDKGVVSDAAFEETVRADELIDVISVAST